MSSLPAIEENILSFKQKRSSPNGKPTICTLASGKGGVGRSFISASIGITLSKLGYSVVIVDFDLSGANIHTCLGVQPQLLNLRQYFDGTKTFHEVISSTPMPQLNFVQGFWDNWAPIHLTQELVQKFINDISNLKADFVLIDLGAGTNAHQFEIINSADQRILVSTPEPTSVEKTYRFIESYLCWSIKSTLNETTYEQFVSKLRDYRHHVDPNPFSLPNYLKEISPEAHNKFVAMRDSYFSLIVNGSRSHLDQQLGYSMKSVCSKYFHLNIEYLGPTAYDNSVWQSVRAKEPVLIAQPFTPLAGEFLSICKNLVHPNFMRAVV